MKTQANILDFAKQGNPHAIKTLMNRSLKPKGINVRVSCKDQCLTVIAEASEPPDQSFMVNFVRKGLANLNPQSVKRVVVQGRSTGSASPAWRAGFELNAEVAAAKPRRSEPNSFKAAELLQADEIADLSPSGTQKNGREGRKNFKIPTKSIKVFLVCLRFVLASLLYVICAVSLAAIAVSMKLAAILLAEQYFYNIQIVGEIFRAVEIIELLNVLVFAIVGMGFGVITALLPRVISRQISAIFLIILIPLICCTTDLYRYDNWLREISEREKISYSDAQQITNSFLKNRVGQQGFLGFYLHTAEFPVLPTKKDQMQDVTVQEEKITSKFATVTGITPQTMTILFTISGWGIRSFYFLVAAFASATHFREGLKQIARLSQGNSENQTVF